MRIVLSVFLVIFFSSFVHAEHYKGVNYVALDIEEGGEGPSPDLIMAKFGSKASPSMSTELRIGFGVSSDDFDGIDYKINNMYGAYLKVHASEGVNQPYFIVGYTKGKMSATFEGDSLSDSEDDFSFGIGVDFNNGINLEYTSYIDKDDVELTGLAVGFAF